MNQDYGEIFAQEQLDFYMKLAARAEMEEQQREQRLEEEAERQTSQSAKPGQSERTE